MKNCSKCGQEVTQVYQFRQCKECTVRELRKLTPFMDEQREIVNLRSRNFTTQGVRAVSVA